MLQRVVARAAARRKEEGGGNSKRQGHQQGQEDETDLVMGRWKGSHSMERDRLHMGEE